MSGLIAMRDFVDLAFCMGRVTSVGWKASKVERYQILGRRPATGGLGHF